MKPESETRPVHRYTMCASCHQQYGHTADCQRAKLSPPEVVEAHRLCEVATADYHIRRCHCDEQPNMGGYEAAKRAGQIDPRCDNRHLAVLALVSLIERLTGERDENAALALLACNARDSLRGQLEEAKKEVQQEVGFRLQIQKSKDEAEKRLREAHACNCLCASGHSLNLPMDVSDPRCLALREGK